MAFRSRPHRPRTLAGWALAGLAAGLLVVLAAALAIRALGVTEMGRRMIATQVSGLTLGQAGQLGIEGLKGDVWRDFTIDRLTVSDAKGVWAQADHVAVRWTWPALLGRRLQVDVLTAQDVRVLRRPVLAPAGPPGGALPIGLDIRRLRLRLETLPAFSIERGLFDVSARLRVRRGGRGETGSILAQSLLHAGDSVSAQFEVDQRKPLLVTIQAQEAQGGAIAGSLGLPADQPFSASAHASGSIQAGRLDAALVTGARTPIWAHGAWTRGGGAVGARVSLTASTLTTPYARMFGPEVVAGVALHPAPRGLSDVALVARGQNLNLSIQGTADLERLKAAPGLSVSVKVADLSRIAAEPKMGEGRLQGLLTGAPAAWRFAGRLDVDRIDQSGVQLARVGGPVTLYADHGEAGVQASLTGSGGQGSGRLAALVGPAPKASIDLVRLADGRVLVKGAEVVGAGLRISAKGQRTLLGGLDFSGAAEVSGAAAAQVGAAGKLDVRWSANQGSARTPWRFTADGRGQGFKSGLGELDRLLGASPSLSVRAAYANAVIDISDLTLKGEKASANARGKVDLRGPLALETHWRAEGPFRAGPVQVTGKASGQGDVTGSLGAPRADLKADIGAIDVPNLPLKAVHLRMAFLKEPDGLDGEIALNGDSAFGAARGHAAFRFSRDGVDLAGIDADAGGVKASGALSLRGSSPSSADLQLAIGSGVILTAGQISGTVKIVDGAQPSAAIDLRAVGAALRDAGVTLRAARLSASGPLRSLPFQATADAVTPQGPLSFNGAGVYQQQADGVREISLTGAGKFRQVDVHTLEPLDVRLAPTGRYVRGRLSLGGGRLDLDARQVDGAVTATATVQGVDLKAVNPDFAGKFDADLSLQGRGATLDGVMNARLAGARSVDAASDVAVDGVVKAVLKGGRLTLDSHLGGAKGMKADLSVDLPVEASAAPLRIAIPRNRPMQGRFAVDGEVQPLWDLAYGSEHELAGQVHLAGTIGGDLADPQFSGEASVTGGRFDDYSTGLRLTNLSLSADLKRDLVTLKTLSAKDDKGGAISGSGSISLARGGGSDLKLALANFKLLDNDTAEATATGLVTLTRSPDGKVKITGDLSLNRAQINAEAHLHPSVVTMDVIERNMPERLRVLTSDAGERGPPIELDVKLRATRHVFIKGRGLNAELSLDAHITGNLASPALRGSARIVQGSYDFAGKRFEFDERGQIILADSADDMRLDLSATWEQPSLTATIQIKGTASKPQITLTSAPSLPQEEILSQVVFGASASQLSGAQTAQLASTVTAMATGGGFDVLGSLRQFAGLDRLALGGDQLSGTTIAGGKYISDNVYLEIVGGGRLGPSAEVDWRIRRGLSLVSQIGGEFGAKLSVRWTRDIGDAGSRTRKPKAKGG